MQFQNLIQKIYTKKRISGINEPTDVDVSQGCRFRARCPYVIEKCKMNQI